jgi:hypothetical protein
LGAAAGAACFWAASAGTGAAAVNRKAAMSALAFNDILVSSSRELMNGPLDRSNDGRQR